MHININFPGLEDVILKEFRSFEDRVEIFVEMPVYTHRCPRCGTRTKKIHDYRIQKIRHLAYTVSNSNPFDEWIVMIRTSLAPK